MNRYAITFEDGITIYRDGDTAESAKVVAVAEVERYASSGRVTGAHRKTMTTVASVELVGPAPGMTAAHRIVHSEQPPPALTEYERRVLRHQAKPELPPAGELLP